MSIESPINNFQGSKVFDRSMMQAGSAYAKPKEEIKIGGVKHDAGKVQIELVPPELLLATAEVLTFGANKYGARNWEKGMSWGRIFGALMRHLWAWWGGQGPSTRNFAFGDADAETSYSHLWHASCCMAFLIAYEERGTGTDDRPGAGESR